MTPADRIALVMGGVFLGLLGGLLVALWGLA